jgi:hypothetical protein
MTSYFFDDYSYKFDPEVVRVLSCLPINILEELPEDQLLDLEQAIVSSDGYDVDFRQVIPALPERFDAMLQASLDRRIETIVAPVPKRKQFHWTAQNRSIATTLGFTVLLLGYAAIYPFIQRPATASSEVASGENVGAHPTALPWIQREADCNGAKQTWKNGLCFDSEHSPNF